MTASKNLSQHIVATGQGGSVVSSNQAEALYKGDNNTLQSSSSNNNSQKLKITISKLQSK